MPHPSPQKEPLPGAEKSHCPIYQPSPQYAGDILESYEIELALYKLHEQMFGVAAQSRAALRDARPILQQLNERDPDRARRAAECFRLAVSLLREATVTIGDAVDWDAIAELYHPSEEHFIDTPATWPVMARAHTHSSTNCNGNCNGHGSAPTRRVAAVTVEPVEEAAAPAAQPTEKAEPKTASRARLSSLGRTLKRDQESEKRRFYAIAKDHGMPTGKTARAAIFAALSELFGETLTSHSQLDAGKWGRAASAVQMQELCWTATSNAPTSAPQPR